MSGGEFSLLGFVGHLAALVIETDRAEHDALDHAARIIQDEAKASVGTYQPQSGPFAAWAPLAEATKDDRVRRGYAADEPELRDGTLRDSIERTVGGGRGLGLERVAEVGSNLDIMEFQELGTPNMPPRSILGGAAARKSDDVALVIGETYVAELGLGAGSAIAGSFIPIRR